MELPPIAEVLPHRPPMILLDRIVSFRENAIRCAVTIRRDAIFALEGGVHPLVSLELMAQCAAAYAGMQKFTNGEAPKRGYLLGTRRLEIEVDLLAWGDALDVEAVRTWSSRDLGSFDCTVDRGDERVATATLSVFEGALPS